MIPCIISDLDFLTIRGGKLSRRSSRGWQFATVLAPTCTASIFANIAGCVHGQHCHASELSISAEHHEKFAIYSVRRNDPAVSSLINRQIPGYDCIGKRLGLPER